MKDNLPSANQLKFLEVRPFSKSDNSAAKEVGVHYRTVGHWKQDEDFMVLYDKARKAPLENWKEQINRIRDNTLGLLEERIALCRKDSKYPNAVNWARLAVDVASIGKDDLEPGERMRSFKATWKERAKLLE